MGVTLAFSVPRLVLMIIGFVPIMSLCVALFQLVSLPATLIVLILPSMAIAGVVATRHPTLGVEALLGLMAGMIATGLYDLIRFGFILGGMWQDFIPCIGRLALDTPDASPLWGYLWRYVGNGGAMGMTFMLLSWRGARTGMLYGTAICCCLFGTLLWAPDAQLILFRLTPLSAVGALGGHLVYGAVLGELTRLMHCRSASSPQRSRILGSQTHRTTEIPVAHGASLERPGVA
jgi:hypothetical protein